MNQLSRRITLVLATALLLVLSSCKTEAPPASATPQLVRRAAVSMGSNLTLTAWTPDEAGAQSAFDAILDEFHKLDQLMSTWLDNSDIQQLNAAAGDKPVPVAPEVIQVLRTAREMSEWTQGKFDITFAALSGLWKFDSQNQDDSIPDPKQIRQQLSLINYRDVQLDEHTGTAFLKRKGMRVNLGGIGKGYAVDRAAAILRSKGFNDFMIQFGGDMYVAGNHGDRPWNVGIRDPRGPADRPFATLELSEGTFSTSGDYERFFIKDGRRYHHIIDPTTGEPALGCRSVTIVTDRAVIADGLSKGVFLLGPQAGMALIERLPNVEGVIVSSTNEVLVSSGLKEKLVLLAPPTDAP